MGIYLRLYKIGSSRTALSSLHKIITLYFFTLLLANRVLASYSNVPGNTGSTAEQSSVFIDNKTHKVSSNLFSGRFTRAITSTKAGMNQTDQPPAQFKINLYVVEANGSAYLVDGVLNQFADRYSDAIDEYDAEKLSNFGEGLSINSQGRLLVVERKQPISINDTIHLDMSKMKVKSYRFELIGINFDPSLNAYLEDGLYNTRIPLNINDTSRYDFNVVDMPGSWNPSRFKVVFGLASAGPLPITFSSVKAYEQNKNITVEWRAENEKNISKYEVEKSTGGQSFARVISIPAKLNNGSSVTYQWLDINPSGENNYYRIKSIDINGEIQYSTIVKVFSGQATAQITAYPNPLKGGNINLRFVNQPEGIYLIRLTNNYGQVIMSRKIEHNAGSNTETLRMNSTLAHGAFRLEITKPGNTPVNINVLN